MSASETFRKNMLEAMKDRGIDAATLSRKAGLNARAVKDIEEGRSQSPKLSTAVAIADALGMDITELLQTHPRHLLARELADFLAQYDQEDQLRLLSAFQALSRPSPE